MICVNHDETFSLNYDKVLDTLSTINKIFVLNKKDILYHIPLEEQLYDLKLLDHNLNVSTIPIYNHYYNQFPTKSDINKIIPVAKHFELLENTFNSISKINVLRYESNWYKFYNNYLTSVYYSLEISRLKIDPERFSSHFNPTFSSYSIENEEILTRYNLYNITSRPSNSFNNINFNTLNKETGCRSSFVPKNDLFVEMDFESFHIRILGYLAGYNFTESNIHEYLGKQYFNVETLTEAQYKKSKEKTFQIIYNEAIEKYQHIELFKKIKEYKDKKWNEYKLNGSILSDISGKPINNIEKKTQLLPYILHNYETELNVIKMYKILALLSEQRSSLVLYNFDSITLDFCKDEQYLLQGIRDILEENGKYPTKTKISETLEFV